jgi:hypothetical protein
MTVVAALASGQSHKQENSIDIDVGIGKSEGAISGALLRDWHLGKKNRIIVGIGGRATGYVGRNVNYVTAPAELTSDGTGPLVIFKQNIVANMDTLLIARPGVFGLNGMINLGYQFTEKLTIGFNIDAIGFSVGGKEQGRYTNGAQGQTTSGTPTSFNILLVSDNDRGSLNSELYAKYRMGDKLSLKPGLQFLFTEYTTATKVQQFPQPNDRFRKKSLMFMIGFSFKI